MREVRVGCVRGDIAYTGGNELPMALPDASLAPYDLGRFPAEAASRSLPARGLPHRRPSLPLPASPFTAGDLPQWL